MQALLESTRRDLEAQEAEQDIEAAILWESQMEYIRAQQRR